MAPRKPAEIMPPTAGNDSLFKTRQIHLYELAWIRKRHIWTGALGNIYGTLLTPTSVYFTFFCFALGMSKFQFGIMQALTAFAVAAQMFSWVFEELWGNRKYPWYIFCIASRLCYVPIVFSHWIPISPDGIIALCVVSAVLSNLSAPSWSSWLYDLIPEQEFARFMAKRSAIIQILTIGLALGAAVGMQYGSEQQKLETVRWVFAVGVLLGLIDLIFHVRIPEPHQSFVRSERKFIKVLTQPLGDRKFRLWMAVYALWMAAVNIAGPFCVPYMLKELGFENRFLALVLMAVGLMQISGFVALLFWGRIIDTIGSRNCAIVCYGAWTVQPLFYTFSAYCCPNLLMIISWVLSGVFVHGAVVVNETVMSTLTKGKKRSTYVALMTICWSVFGGIGTLAGSLIVKYYSLWHVFHISFVARLIAIAVLAVVITKAEIGCTSSSNNNRKDIQTDLPNQPNV